MTRASQIHAENRARIAGEREKMAAKLRVRKTVDYSASGEALAAEAPLSVDDDPLLQLLKEGRR